MANKPPAYCEFCGTRGVTKQHVWPDWMGRHFSESTAYHVQDLFDIKLLRSPSIAVLQPRMHFSQGPFHTRKLRIACQKCNSGWMSRIESKAKPTLELLAPGIRPRLDLSAQQALAAWLALFTMVAEFTDRRTVAVTPEERSSLREYVRPSFGWRMWMGFHDDNDWKHRFFHHAVAAYPTHETPPEPPPFNCQFTTIGFGSALFHTAWTPYDSSQLHLPDRYAKRLASVWPTTSPELDCSGMVPLLPPDIAEVCNYFALPPRPQ